MKYLYLIQARINEPLAYKIGVSSNPEHRRQQLQGSNFALLETICTFQTTQYRFLEKWLHNQFYKYHFINGGQEWFEPKNAILSGVKRLKNLFESIDENGHDTIAYSNHKFLLDYMIGYVESLPTWLKKYRLGTNNKTKKIVPYMCEPQGIHNEKRIPCHCA